MKSSKLIEFLGDNLVEVTDSNFETSCMEGALVKVVDSECGIHSKSCGNVVKVVDSDNAIHSKASNVIKIVDSEYEIHSKAGNNMVKVLESEYEIHSKAGDNVVKVVESNDEIHSKASDAIKAGESKYELCSMASEVNELSDVKDVGGTKAKQGRVSEVIVLASVAAG